MATTKRKSRIVDEMHETVRGLHGAGLISKRRMGEFDMPGAILMSTRWHRKKSSLCANKRR